MCVVLPGKRISEKQLTKLLSSAGMSKPAGGEVGDGMGRPRLGNGVCAMFALTDCLQVRDLFFFPW